MEQYQTAINQKIVRVVEELKDMEITVEPLSLLARNAEEYLVLDSYRAMRKEALISAVHKIVINTGSKDNPNFKKDD
jgi:hypothetical protein